MLPNIRIDPGTFRSLKPHMLDGCEEVQAVIVAVSRRRMMVTRHVSVTYSFAGLAGLICAEAKCEQLGSTESKRDTWT